MTPKRTQPPAQPSLDAVLAIEYLPRFYDELWKLTMPAFKLPLAELPELVRMVRVMLFLDFHVRYTRGGIEEFLSDWISETNEYFSTYFHDAERWCRDIGAHRAAAYLRAVGALFPGGKVPTDAAKCITSVVIQLRALWINVSNEGMWKFLVEGAVGSQAHFTEAWCRRIGAKRAAAYLAAAAKLFPRGRIPEDDGERGDIVMEFWERSPDPLRQLDGRYEGAVDEMVERFRAYLRARQDDIEGALTTPAGKAAPAKRRRAATTTGARPHRAAGRRAAGSTRKRARPKPRRR